MLLGDRMRPAEAEWPPWAGLTLRAWSDIQYDRPAILTGAGAAGGFILRTVEGPIPWRSVERWAARHGIDGDDFSFLLKMIRALDAEYLDSKSKKN